MARPQVRPTLYSKILTMTKFAFAITPFALLLPFITHASEADCVIPQTQAVTALFERWNASLQTGDSSKVADNYATGAVLLPTLSDQPRLERAQKIEYFDKFLKNKPVGTVNTRKVFVSCNNAVDTGTYTFKFADNSSVSARFTFTYTWQDNQWLITTHHSSAMPAS